MTINTYMQDLENLYKNKTSLPKEVNFQDITFSDKSLISIDGSSTDSGIAVFSMSSTALIFVESIRRNKSSESVIEYKVRLKEHIKQLFSKYNVSVVMYEKPVIDNASAVETTFILSSMIEEIIVEEKPKYDKVILRKNTANDWRSYIVSGREVTITELAKQAVLREMSSVYGVWLNILNNDNIGDAVGMGHAFLHNSEAFDDKIKRSIAKKKRYKFSMSIYTCDNDDEFREASKTKITEIYELKKSESIEFGVYYNMEDGYITAVRFKMDTHADGCMKYGLYNKMKDRSKKYVYILAMR